MSTLLGPRPTTLPGQDQLGGVPDRAGAEAATLRALAAGPGHGQLTWTRPGPSAAFSRRDTARPGFGAAVDAVRARGFEPFVRPVGGHLAAYDDGCLVLDVRLRLDEPRSGTTARFRELAAALSVGLRRLGVDARTGEVPGEYCPGTWSVGARGRTKLVGTGQRLVRGAVLLTAVVVVQEPGPLRAAMEAAYPHLGLSMDPAVVGAVADEVPGVSLAEVEDVLAAALAERLPLSAPDLVGAREVLGTWDPR